MDYPTTGYLAPGYLAPGADAHPQSPLPSNPAVSCPGAVSRPWPSLDDRLVTPETPYEMLDGKLVMAPSTPAHGERQNDVGTVLRIYAAPGYLVVADVLTRVDKRSDIAPDVSVMRDGIDPQTGERYLEELAFEIKYTQRAGQLSRRATLLARRGVRRIFAVWVSKRKGVISAGPVKEWQPKQAAWQPLAEDALIEDPCLQYPLPVRALLNATAADEAVARAMTQSRHPLIQRFSQEQYQQGEADGYQQGEADGYKRALCQVAMSTCTALAIELSQERLAALAAMDARQLMALHDYLLMHRRWPDL